MKNNKCKICRRLGEKLFLKGEKCMSPKCPMVRKPYPPGLKSRRRGRGGLSEYGKELKEKQKLKNWYNLSESQLKKYVKESLRRRGRISAGSSEEMNPSVVLIKKIESRLDNVVFQLGFARSRSQARQLVSSSHFLVNNKSVNIPSCQLKRGDEIAVKPASLKKKFFKDLVPILKKKKPVSWLELEPEKMKGKIKNVPSLEEIAPPVELSAIFEFYSR